jgi:hypothetical protein
MNQAARRKATGIGRSANAASISPSWLSRFGCSAAAPIADRATTLDGVALVSAARSAAIIALASGKPGDGSKIGGSITKAPSAPASASTIASGFSIAATANSAPWAVH